SDLTRGSIEANNGAVPSAAVNPIGIQRIGRDEGIFKAADGKPILREDFAVIAATENAGGPAVLLRRIDAIRECIVAGDVIELPGRLVVPGTPTLAAIHADDGALVHSQNHARRIVRIDPEGVEVVPAGSSDVSF